MRALGYKQAINWIVMNDDTEWLDDECPIPSVTACLVADLYGVDIEKVIKDLKKNVHRGKS